MASATNKGRVEIMRKLSLIAAAGLGLMAAGSAHAAAICTAQLLVQPTADPTIFNVLIQAKADGTPAGPDNGGISGMQFDVLSVDVPGLKVSPVPLAPSGPNFGKVATTFNISGFSTQNPLKQDATPAVNPTANPPYVGPDGDFDALGGSFFDTGAFTNENVGKSGFQTIATEQWSVPAGNSDHLRLYVISPTYYDNSASTSNFQKNFDSVAVQGGDVLIGSAGAVPEPASVLALASLGGLGLIRRRRA
jgi:hypothetical protein